MNNTMNRMVELDIDALHARFYVRDDGALINKYTNRNLVAGSVAGKLRQSRKNWDKRRKVWQERKV